ncbi:MAG: ABC transporter ATP-binding protein [Alphaproteobacteria bacterium]
MIEASEISKSFGPTRALDAVSFTVAEGEVVGLLGPNGSGKTTLLRILTGFFPPDAGGATVAGVRLADDPFEVRRRVGYLPERTPLWPEMSVARFLALAASVRVPDRALRPERVASVLRECSLDDVANRRIGHLSKGYRQRVGIAQALVGRPHVLVLDEPTAGLDPAQVLELRQLVAGLAGRTTVVFSSHILADVASVCDRVLVLHRGRLVLAERIDALRREAVRSGELVLRTRGDAHALAALLGDLPGLRLGSVEGDGEGGLLARLSRVDPDRAEAHALEAAAAEVARRCVGAGFDVLEVGPRRRTLEDVFVEILGGER